MTEIESAQYYRSGRPRRQLISVKYRDGLNRSGVAEALLPELESWLKEGNKILPENPKGYPNHVRPAYQDHPIFEQPSSDAAKIWRYMAFEQLLSLLSRQALWFSRAFALREADPFEGMLPIKNVERSPEDLAEDLPFLKKIPSERRKEFLATHREFQKRAALNLVSCFNIADHESNAMWRVYGKGSNCVAFTTSLSRLKKCFGQYTDYDVYIGRIKYVDYSNAFLNESNYLQPLLHKAMFYSYENEMRCVIPDDGDIRLFNDSEPNPLTYVGSGPVLFEDFSRGAYVPVDLELLLEQVIIGPDAERWFLGVVQDVLSRYGLSIRAKPSALRPS